MLIWEAYGSKMKKINMYFVLYKSALSFFPRGLRIRIVPPLGAAPSILTNLNYFLNAKIGSVYVHTVNFAMAIIIFNFYI